MPPAKTAEEMSHGLNAPKPTWFESKRSEISGRLYQWDWGSKKKSTESPQQPQSAATVSGKEESSWSDWSMFSQLARSSSKKSTSERHWTDSYNDFMTQYADKHHDRAILFNNACATYQGFLEKILEEKTDVTDALASSINKVESTKDTYLKALDEIPIGLQAEKLAHESDFKSLQDEINQYSDRIEPLLEDFLQACTSVQSVQTAVGQATRCS